MGKTSRTKGATGEREFAGLIHDELGIRMVRRLTQYQSGGCDLQLAEGESGPIAQSLDRYAYEVKRHRKATPALLRAWWAQACNQADDTGKTPALAYREDRAHWRVLIPLAALDNRLPHASGIEWTAALSIAAFCAVVRELN
jgi:hypothetical protein